MLLVRGQSHGVGLSGREVFSCFVLNFDPLPEWPLDFTFFFLFLFLIPSKIISP